MAVNGDVSPVSAAAQSQYQTTRTDGVDDEVVAGTCHIMIFSGGSPGAHGVHDAHDAHRHAGLSRSGDKFHQVLDPNRRASQRS